MADDLRWYKLPAKRWQERNSENIRIWRDSQKTKVYFAENHLRFQFKDVNTKFNSIKEIEHYVNKLLKSVWFVRRWGRKKIQQLLK